VLSATRFASAQRIVAAVAESEPDRQVFWVLKGSAAVRLPLSLIASRVKPLLDLDGDSVWVFDESPNGFLVDLSEDWETAEDFSLGRPMKWMLEVLVWGEEWAARASGAA